MNKYCFILGNNPALSLAEIFQRDITLKSNFKVIDITDQSLIIEQDDLDITNWQAQLGGVIKIGTITGSFDSFDEVVSFLENSANVQLLFRQRTKKIVFGLSLYGQESNNKNKSILNQLGFSIKKTMTARGMKSRFIKSVAGQISSVQTQKHKLIERGADILIISGSNKYYLGTTESIQDFEDYSFRDFDRPKRDAVSGMLPPKVAKIMINLAGATAEDTLLDPFCGSGTILQEAALMGIQNITGSDNSKKAINNTKQNFKWLSKEYKLDSLKLNLIESDAITLDQKIPTSSTDIIVTEPYLGPPIRKKPSQIKMEDLVHELETLYVKTFHTLTKITKPTARVVIIFPLFKTDYGTYTLRILETLASIGWHRLNPFPAHIPKNSNIGPTARGSVIYRRPGQKIEREIFIFQRKKS
ncbi:RsmD family RNA methyltransferase [Patescibacteria group bacterium]|nr:RsmD family RNA methyltransferase [Patescibacteria group bacterium]